MNFRRARKKTKLSDQVAKTLRYQILSGELYPEQHLVESYLASEFGVSNGPLREALHCLESEGFITTHANGRAVVNEISQDFIDEYQKISKHLLLSASFRIIEQVKSGIDIGPLLDDLDDCCKHLKKSIAVGNSRGINDVDDAFTTAIILASRNIMLRTMWFLMDGIRHGLYDVMVDSYCTMVFSNKELLDNFYQIRNAIAEGKDTEVQKCIDLHYTYRGWAYDDFASKKESLKKNMEEFL